MKAKSTTVKEDIFLLREIASKEFAYVKVDSLLIYYAWSQNG